MDLQENGSDVGLPRLAAAKNIPSDMHTSNNWAKTYDLKFTVSLRTLSAMLASLAGFEQLISGYCWNCLHIQKSLEAVSVPLVSGTTPGWFSATE